MLQLLKRIFPNLKVGNQDTSKVEEKSTLNTEIVLPKKKKTAILLDTSIINYSAILDLLKEMNTTILFPSLVVEELSNCRSKANFVGRNARNLLSMATQPENKVLLTPIASSLPGWSNNNSDSRIIQVALDHENEYDITIYSCDKEMICKAKSLEIKCKYFKSETPYVHSYSSTSNTEDIVSQNDTAVPLFSDILEMNEITTLENIGISGSSITITRKSTSFPYYYKSGTGNRILSLNRPCSYLHLGDIIYEVTSTEITKYKILNCSSFNNAIILRRGILLSEITSINPIHISFCINELNLSP